MKFCWTTISVQNMEKSLSFYQDFLGLILNRRIQPTPDMELAFLGEDTTQVELIWNKHNPKPSFGKDISLGFEVPSIDEITKALTDKNIPIHSGPFQPNPFIRFIYVQDPDGLKIQFVENIKTTK